MLFGQKKARKKAKYLFNCEGEEDTLSVFQSLVEFNASTDKKGRYTHLTPAVTGIGCGTVHAREHIANNKKFVDQYEEVRLCYDNDELTEDEKRKKNPGKKGKEATRDVGNFLMTHRVRVVVWPDDVNDCNDLVKCGRSYELAKLLLFETEEYDTAEIVGLYDVFKEGELAKPLNKGVYLESFPFLMDRLLGIRMRECTLILAPTGSGKSSIGAEIGFNFAEEYGGVGGIFLEEGLAKTTKRFISRKLEIHPNLYKFDPLKFCTYDQYLEAERWVGDTKNFMFINHYGPIKIDQLIDLATIFIYKYNRKLIILDHISLTILGDGQIEERAELEKAMIKLTTLCEQCDVHIQVIAHINRAASTTLGGDRDLDKPKWKRTFITDGKGTQALETLAHNIITIDQEIIPDGTRGRIRLFLGKNREADNLGFCDIVRMHPETGVFYDASQEVWQPKTQGY
jgi:hypothetical protein